ncbi:hypothetical protein I2I05_07935 [Hymenobacter sp. BT683]|uniref:DUF6799 domain-containing protein n=1 Tax=Hymenobacter jeongseonensis TaxID=2791027 RepID=A0ABS0IG65_9BACT|nr:DUF6799 domain-containing protein [Hymenobacter jeongseonensis]MBF9237325.1 hypothetical protein [Hymenobacter jeongseonensis]
MLKFTLRAFGAACLLMASTPAVRAQTADSNDGYQRRNGQMHVVRNGQTRLMTRDAHLPTGATVTKDGFVVSATGKRTELREGQGCDLKGQPVAVRMAADGRLALATPTAQRSVVAPSHSILEQLFGTDDEDEKKSYSKHKKAKKNRGKGKGRWKGGDD